MSEPLFEHPVADLALARPVRAKRGKRFLEVPVRSQQSLQVRCVEDMVPRDAYVRVVAWLVGQLDLSWLEGLYPGGGRPAYDPRLLVALLVYANTIGVRSARELSRRLEYDLNFLWLASETRIDHRTICRFRRKLGDGLKLILRQVVKLAIDYELPKLGCIAIDGTKIAASAKRRALKAEQFDEAFKRIDEQLAKILEEAEACDAAEDAAHGDSRGDAVEPAALDLAALQARREKLLKKARRLQHRRERHLQAQEIQRQTGQERISVTDPEALVQKTQDGKRPGYNGQIAVDTDSGLIMAAELVSDQNDTAQLIPMTEQVKTMVGAVPPVVVADAGYQSPETLEAAETLPSSDEANSPLVTVYIAQRPAKPDGLWGHERFSYDAERDLRVCPEGHELPFKTTKSPRGERQYRVYRASAYCCRDCPRRAECIRPKTRQRELMVSPQEPLLAAMREAVAGDAGKAALQRRSETVEPAFGVIKAVQGLRQYLLRGLEGARIEFLLGAVAFNIRKLAWAVYDGRIDCPLMPSESARA